MQSNNGFSVPTSGVIAPTQNVPDWAIIPGLIHVTGDYDAGKTTFALSCGADPGRIMFLDWDIKGRLAAGQLARLGTPLGAYYNLVKLSEGKRELDFHREVMAILNSIKPGDFDCLVFDTYSFFESTIHPWVVENISTMRSNISKMGEIKGAQTWLAAFDYEALILDNLLSKVPVIFLITHLKNHTVGGHRSGKRIPDVKKPVFEKSAFRIWLTHGNNVGGAPNGLVLKRFSKLSFVPGQGIQPTNVVPYKLSPATWAHIRQYWENPLGDREPDLAERMTQDEIDAVSQNLTEFHRFVIQLEVAQAQKLQDEEAAIARQIEQATAKRAAELNKEGKAPAEIAKELNATVPQVLGWIRAVSAHQEIQKEKEAPAPA